MEPTKKQVEATIAYLEQEFLDQVAEMVGLYSDFDGKDRERFEVIWKGPRNKLFLYIGVVEHPVLTYLLEQRIKGEREYFGLFDQLRKYVMEYGALLDEYDADYQRGKLFIIANTLEYLGRKDLSGPAMYWATENIFKE